MQRKGFAVLAFLLFLLNIFLYREYLFEFSDEEVSAEISSRSEASGTLPSQESVEIILTGDVMLGRTVMTTSLDLGDPFYPFRKVEETLSKADIVFVNLENPVIEGCPRHEDGFKFCTTPGIANGLVYAGIDVVNLANNHTLNYGNDGLTETKAVLDSLNVKSVGLGNLVVFEKEGTSFGFLGFDYVLSGATQANLKLIRDADREVDTLIVAVHWGQEYQSVANTFQRENARKLIDAGADVVVGHHPHWVQDYEYIDGKPVYYSLGNFVFDQMWSEETKKGMAVRLTFKGQSLQAEEFLPIYMREWAQPEFLGN